MLASQSPKSSALIGLWQRFRRALQQLFRTQYSHHLTARTLANLLLISLKLHPIALIAQITGMLSLLASFWTEALGHYWLIGWFCIGCVQIYCSLTFVRRFWLDRDRVQNVREWVRRWTWLGVFSGLLWGIAGSAMMFSLSGLSQVVTVAVVVAVTFASWPVYSCWLPSLTAFTLFSLTPMTIAVALQYGVSETLLALVVFTVGGFILYSGRKLNEIMLASIINDNENRRLVERLRQEITTSEQARREAVQDSARRARFFAAANHDIRQPLQAMGIYVGILKSKVGPDLKPMVEQLAMTGSSISTLVEQVLTVTRMEFGQLENHPERIAVKPFLERCAMDSSAIAKKRGLILRVVAPECVEIEADPGMLTRALKNLLSNAVNYSDPTRDKPEIVIGARVVKGECVIGIYDCGPGLTPQDRQKVFETFWRGSAGKASSTSGYGLGLSIVQGLARQMNAKVSVGSKPGLGSVFRLAFSALVCAQVRHEIDDDSNARQVPNLDGLVILVEDNTMLRQAVKSLLEGWGAEVIDSPGINEDLLRHVVHEQSRLLACVSDYNLGDNQPTGVEVAQRINERLSKNIPLILLTAVARDLIEARMRQEGWHLEPPPVILQKPIDPDVLNHAVTRVAKRRLH